MTDKFNSTNEKIVYNKNKQNQECSFNKQNTLSKELSSLKYRTNPSIASKLFEDRRQTSHNLNVREEFEIEKIQNRVNYLEKEVERKQSRQCNSAMKKNKSFIELNYREQFNNLKTKQLISQVREVEQKKRENYQIKQRNTENLQSTKHRLSQKKSALNENLQINKFISSDLKNKLKTDLEEIKRKDIHMLNTYHILSKHVLLKNQYQNKKAITSNLQKNRERHQSINSSINNERLSFLKNREERLSIELDRLKSSNVEDGSVNIN